MAGRVGRISWNGVHVLKEVGYKTNAFYLLRRVSRTLAMVLSAAAQSERLAALRLGALQSRRTLRTVGRRRRLARTIVDRALRRQRSCRRFARRMAKLHRRHKSQPWLLRLPRLLLQRHRVGEECGHMMVGCRRRAARQRIGRSTSSASNATAAASNNRRRSTLSETGCGRRTIHAVRTVLDTAVVLLLECVRRPVLSVGRRRGGAARLGFAAWSDVVHGGNGVAGRANDGA